MSWIAVTAKKKVHLYQKKYNKWTHDTSIKFLSKYEMLPTLNQYLLLELSDIVSEYAIFYLDLAWCNIDQFYTLYPPQLSRGEHVNDLLKMFVIDGEQKEFINNLNLLFTNYYVLECYIFINKFEKNNKIQYENCITFGHHGHKKIYDIRFKFIERHIEDLLKINSFEKFVLFLEENYKNEKVYLCGNYEYKYMEEYQCGCHYDEIKLKIIWELWRKIIGPRIVFHNLERVTEY